MNQNLLRNYSKKYIVVITAESPDLTSGQANPRKGEREKGREGTGSTDQTKVGTKALTLSQFSGD